MTHLVLLLAITQLVPGGGTAATRPISKLLPPVSVVSWYRQGTQTASGEEFFPAGYTAASRTLQFDTEVLLLYSENWLDLSTWRFCKVRINDRGPSKPERDLDISEGAADQLGLKKKGVAPMFALVLPKRPGPRASLPPMASLPMLASHDS